MTTLRLMTDPDFASGGHGILEVPFTGAQPPAGLDIKIQHIARKQWLAGQGWSAADSAITLPASRLSLASGLLSIRLGPEMVDHFNYRDGLRIEIPALGVVGNIRVPDTLRPSLVSTGAARSIDDSRQGDIQPSAVSHNVDVVGTSPVSPSASTEAPPKPAPATPPPPISKPPAIAPASTPPPVAKTPVEPAAPPPVREAAPAQPPPIAQAPPPVKQSAATPPPQPPLTSPPPATNNTRTPEQAPQSAPKKGGRGWLAAALGLVGLVVAAAIAIAASSDLQCQIFGSCGPQQFASVRQCLESKINDAPCAANSCLSGVSTDAWSTEQQQEIRTLAARASASCASRDTAAAGRARACLDQKLRESSFCNANTCVASYLQDFPNGAARSTLTQKVSELDLRCSSQGAAATARAAQERVRRCLDDKRATNSVCEATACLDEYKAARPPAGELARIESEVGRMAAACRIRRAERKATECAAEHRTRPCNIVVECLVPARSEMEAGASSSIIDGLERDANRACHPATPQQPQTQNTPSLRTPPGNYRAFVESAGCNPLSETIDVVISETGRISWTHKQTNDPARSYWEGSIDATGQVSARARDSGFTATGKYPEITMNYAGCTRKMFLRKN